MQQMKLYDKLNIKLFVSFIHQHSCTISLNDEEMLMLNEAFSLRDMLSETEESAL